ncbi:MAG: DUF1801 domain-containing protein [Acidobacteria bacterium]|nr:DUF1801 domain-containing protein [Acidobacteriota bacterium]
MNPTHSFEDARVGQVFLAYPAPLRERLLALRELIFEVAAGKPEVGSIEETLRWGQPTYLTRQTKSGSMIRIDQINGHDDQFALYVHCQTGLVDQFKARFPNTFQYEGNRALLFDTATPLPLAELSVCIELALTYHLNKRKSK